MNALLPAIAGVIDRRMLLNYRVRPEAVKAWLPPRFRPKLVRGWAVAGICLIRLKHIRPRGLPAILGLASENAAHRVAVEWDDLGVAHQGVYVPRRDTSALANVLAGGRVFPGELHLADFEVSETDDRLQLRAKSRDGATAIEVDARRTEIFTGDSIFSSLAEASDFFAGGSIGYSATEKPDRWDGIELHTSQWRVEPLAVEKVSSSFFDDTRRFPIGTIEFDNGLLMRNIQHEWHTMPALRPA